VAESDFAGSICACLNHPPATHASFKRAMTQSQRHNALVYVLATNAILLAGIFIALLARSDRAPFASIALAQDRGAMPMAPQPIAGGGGLFLMPAQFASNTWGCYIMDVDQQTLCAYQYSPGERQLRLVAARSFRFDRRLKNFNTDNPSPREVERMLEKEQDKARVTATQPAPPPAEKQE